MRLPINLKFAAIFDNPKRLESMKVKVLLLCSILLATGAPLNAQVTGGQSAFEFLSMSNSPQVSAFGGVMVATPQNDVSLVMQNPALMRPGLHDQLSLNYNSFYSDISTMNLQYGYYVPKLNTSFFGAIQYNNYGSLVATNASGVVTGDFRAAEYAFTVGASKKYGEHWRYGADIKGAVSSLGAGYASAVLMDVGVNYYDTSSLWDFGMVARNMGTMIQKYTEGNGNEPLPFDLRLGISKRFKHVPLRLFGTIHHLADWDIRYDNPEDKITTNIIGTTDTDKSNSSHTGDKILRHIIVGAQLTLGERLVITGSYNFLRRKELLVTSKPGTAGFAFGANLNLNKLQVHYARTYYHVSGPYNELGLSFVVHKWVPTGKFGTKKHWNADYPDWD